MPAKKPASFATTLNYLSSPEFAARTTCFVKRPPPGGLKMGLRIFIDVLKLAWKEDKLLLSSSWGRIHPELLAAAVIGLWPRRLRPMIFLLGCMWEPDSGLRGWLERFTIRLADRAIHRYIVQSTEELEIFPRLWNVPAGKVRFCPFFYSFTEEELASVSSSVPGRFVFAGGNSMRDYEPLLEAARRLPELQFVLATRLLDDRTDLPANIKTGLVPHKTFVSLMYSSAATIVPIQPNLHRAAGQQTYLNAMWMGRPTIVTNTLGVHDHIRDMETGLIVDGTADGYVRALKWLFDPANCEAVHLMSSRAQKDVIERFGFENHITCLLGIIDEAAADK